MFIASPPDMRDAALLVARRCAQFADAHDADGSLPVEAIGAVRQAGLLPLPQPRELGGRGGGLAEAAAVVGLVAAGDASAGLILAQHYFFLRHTLFAASSSRALKEKIARSSAQDGGLGNLLRVEPDLGSSFRGGLPATTARRVEGGWRISGRKIYSTGAPALSWLAVYACVDDEAPQVGSFVVPAAAAGVRVEESWNHVGMRASASHDVILDDVLIPHDHALDLRAPGEAGDDTETAWLATLFAVVYDGVARAARDWFVNFLKTRAPSNLGAPLATLPRMQETLGAIDALLYVNRALIDDVAACADSGFPPAPTTSYFMKTTANANAIAAVEKALEASGNPGLSRANPLQRHYRDVLCARVHSPQKDSVLVAAGRAALGL